MTEQTEHTTLQRKAGTGRPPSDGAGMTAPKAFRLALSKAAEVELGMALRAQTIKEEMLNQAQVLEALDSEALLLTLEGPHDARGVAIFDIQALSAVIEVQTLGNVIASEATARRPTRIDSAMCEALLDRVLKEFEEHLVGTPAADWSRGFRFGKQISSLRLLGLALTDVPYRLFHLPLDLADGAKQGMLQIVLPAHGVRPQAATASGDDGWAQAMELVVGEGQVEITGVLHKVQKTLSEVQAMVVGDLINLPQTAVTSVLMQGSDGCEVGGARLGQQNGFRALRVSGDDALVPPMNKLVADAPAVNMASTAAPEPDLASEMPAMDMAMPAAMDTMPDIGGGDDAAAFPAVDIPMPDMANMADAVGVAAMGDLPDLPMMPMDAAPMEGLDALAMAPMAAAPMDIEIA